MINITPTAGYHSWNEGMGEIDTQPNIMLTQARKYCIFGLGLNLNHFATSYQVGCTEKTNNIADSTQHETFELKFNPRIHKLVLELESYQKEINPSCLNLLQLQVFPCTLVLQQRNTAPIFSNMGKQQLLPLEEK